MPEPKKYWIADPEGVKAVVEGADALAEWTRVRGWVETTEPVGLEFQWIRNVDHGGKGVLNHAAVPDHEGRGWFPCGPPGYDDAPAAAPTSSPTPKPAANATSGDKKE
jgi:hypothetical protein